MFRFNTSRLFTVIVLFILVPIITTGTPASEKVNVAFRVDVTTLINKGIFNPSTDKVYVRGWFNNWDYSNEMAREALTGFVYSCIVPIDTFTYYEYKYYINSPGAPNNGNEDSVGVAYGGTRYSNTQRFESAKQVHFFNNEEPTSENIEITTPAAGGIWQSGTIHNITWNASGISNVKIEYTTDKGYNWNTAAESLPASAGSFTWTPDFVSYECRIRISEVSTPANVEYSPLLVIYGDIANEVPPLMSVEYPVFTWPLNAYYPNTVENDDQIIKGKVGNACGPTVVANALRYWEYPRTGKLSRTFTDVLGCYWSADFENTEYLYDRMPKNIPSDAPDSVYSAAATLMFHAGVGMHNAYRTGSGDGVVEAFHYYFNYNRKSKLIERTPYTPAQWEKIVKSELSAGRTLVTANIGHWFFMDGYNSSNLFHIRWDYGEQNDEYLPLIRSGDAEKNNSIIIFLEPELNGKKIKVTWPNGGENLKQNDVVNLTWESTNVSEVKIEYSINNGYDWTEIANHVPASSGSYTWTNNAEISKQCKIRITDAEDINVYDKSNNVFGVYDVKELAAAQTLNSYIQSGTIVTIRWRAKGFSKIVIQYSADDGNNWINISEEDASNLSYRWTVPDVRADKCRIRLSDKDDAEIFSVTDVFEIGADEVQCGPYKEDANTAALLHFDGGLINEYFQAYNAVPANNIEFFDNMEMGLDYGLRINNSGTVCSNIEIPDYSKLDLKKDWTIELWFKINSWGSGITAYPYLLFKAGANYFITLNYNSKTLAAGYDYGSGAELLPLHDGSITTGKWYHLTFIRNTTLTSLKCILRDSTRQVIAEDCKAYIPSHIPVVNDKPVSIGGTSENGNIQFDGYVDELRISDIVRPVCRLQITAPTGGEKLIAGSKYTITWKSSGVLFAKIEYSTNNGTKWTTIKSNTYATTGSTTWNVPNITAEECIIRIRSTIDGTIGDTTDTKFLIQPAESVAVISPNGGELWNCGTSQLIKWTSASVDNVKIEFSSNGGENWNTVVESYPADSTEYNWQVPSGTSNNCLIKISSVENPAVSDVSDAAFTTDIAISVSEKWQPGIPAEYNLFQNFPNPFNPVTVIRYNLPEAGNVSLVVYNMLGQKVKELVNEFRSAGYYQAEFNAAELPSGMYVYKLQAGSYISTKKLLLIK